MFQPCSGYPSPPSPPDLTPITTPYFTLQRRFALSLHPLIPPNSTSRGATIHLEGAPSAGLHCFSEIPSLYGWPQGVPRASLWLASLVRFSPPCFPRPVSRSLSAPGVLLSKVNVLPLPSSIFRTSAPPPVGLKRRPSPLLVPKGLCRVILSPIPFASASPPPCSTPSFGVFWSLISLRMYFCARLSLYLFPNQYIFICVLCIASFLNNASSVRGSCHCYFLLLFFAATLK